MLAIKLITNPHKVENFCQHNDAICVELPTPANDDDDRLPFVVDSFAYVNKKTYIRQSSILASLFLTACVTTYAFSRSQL